MVSYDKEMKDILDILLNLSSTSLTDWSMKEQVFLEIKKWIHNFANLKNAGVTDTIHNCSHMLP